MHLAVLLRLFEGGGIHRLRCLSFKEIYGVCFPKISMEVFGMPNGYHTEYGGESPAERLLFFFRRIKERAAEAAELAERIEQWWSNYYFQNRIRMVRGEEPNLPTRSELEETLKSLKELLELLSISLKLFDKEAKAMVDYICREEKPADTDLTEKVDKLLKLLKRLS